MSDFLLLELNPDLIEEPFVVDADGALHEEHCSTCGTTWFDPVPGPLTIDVEAPEDGWEALAPGAMPGATTPLLVLHRQQAQALAAALGCGEVHPVELRTIDAKPINEEARGQLPSWAALWPEGICRRAFDPQDGGEVEACSDCGRFPGEFVEPWSLGLLEASWDGSPLFQVPGWRYSLFATTSAWQTIQSLGVRFLRAKPVPSRPEG